MKYYCPSCKLDNLPKGNGLCVCSDVELLPMDEVKKPVDTSTYPDLRIFYHNNACLANADCGCKIILSRMPVDGYDIIDNFSWVKFCDQHKK